MSNNSYIPRKRFEGISADQEIQLVEKFRDTRSLGKKISDSFIYKPTAFNIALACIFFIIVTVPIIAEIMLLMTGVVGLLLLFYGKKRELPFGNPMSSGKMVIDPKTRERQYFNEDGVKCEGIYFFGNDIEFGGRELWFSDDQARRHMLLFGTTGAGKTEALLSLCYNALITCSGFIFTDGKGTFELYYKVYATCRSLGMEDDLLLISFLTGQEDMKYATKLKYSNTTNPFANAPVDAAVNMLVSLMADGSGDGMWKDRASALMEAVMSVLVYRRDYQKRLISVNSIREGLILSNIYKAWEDAKNTSDPNSPGYLHIDIVTQLRTYLVSLPGFDESKPFKDQQPSIHEQHGFLFMQFTKLLGSLADMYGYIFNTQLSEVDFWDVVVNRRILVVLLPALAKSQNELSMLGKIIIACIKQMTASGLGKYSEGVIQDILENNPTKSRTAFIVILDEYGYYAVPGTAVILAQARGLGFFVIAAGQDFPAFAKGSAEEAESIKANCTIQICMKLQDENDTFNIFAKQAGQGEVAVNTGKNYHQNTLRDNDNIAYEKRERITFRDLNKQEAGEAHYFFSGKMVRGRFMYVKIDLKPNLNVMVNQFIKVAPPELEAIHEIKKGFEDIKNRITNLQYISDVLDEDDNENQDQVINQLSSLFNMYKDEHGKSSELAACATLAHLLFQKKQKIDEEKAKRNIAIENSYQTSYVKSDKIYQANKKLIEERKQDINNVHIDMYGTSESSMKEKLIKRNMMIENNVGSINANTQKAIEDFNELSAYPRESPELKQPRELQDLIAACSKELRRTQELEEEELPI